MASHQSEEVMSAGSKISVASGCDAQPGESGGKKAIKINAKLRMWACKRMLCVGRHADRLFTGKHCILLPKRSAARAQAKEDSDFYMWVKNRGDQDAGNKVRIGMSPHGRALFAACSINKGECMLQVSKHLIITPDKLPDEASSLLSENVSNWAKIALFVLAQQHAGKESAWAPYVRCLPRLGHIHSTIFWKKEELEYLEQSPLHRETMERRTVISYEYSAVQTALTNCTHIFDRVTFQQFKHAYATVCSRAWGFERVKSLAMVPFIDFFNHNASCRTLLSFDEEKKAAEVVADRDYAAGDQITISYGQLSNATLALDFGFTVASNPHDEAEIFICIPKHDPLHESKLKLLHSHNMETVGESSGNRFTLQEVKSSTGRGKGIPQALRAFARVLCASSSEELDQMAEAAATLDGRLARQPSSDNSKECQAMSVLATLVDTQIEKHSSALVAVEKSKLVSSRREIARNVIAGELRVLRSASSWLHEHSETLAAESNRLT